jgi:2-iminoacetate synthase
MNYSEFKELLYQKDFQDLEDLAQRARLATRQRFGKTMELYAPLYISNYCSSACSYCNFSARNKKINRKNLSISEAEREMSALKQRGLDEVLLLTGEMEDERRVDFLSPYISLASQYFTKVGLEIFPASTEEYKVLQKLGISYVTVYQETYNRDVYARVHKSGRKRDFAYRFDTPNRVLASGIRGVGMAILLGLAEPVQDFWVLSEHVRALKSKYWDRDFSISFPRIKDRSVHYPVSDKFLARAIFLFRLLFPDLTMVLSTRESGSFRNGMAGLGINKMSAGSRTTVGGYCAEQIATDRGGQFEIEDMRNIQEVRASLREKGLSPILKNHDRIFN